MKEIVVQKVKEFLQESFKGRGALLVGFSGGPDSLALVYALLECRRYFSFELHLAHIDHGWREESARQALELQRFAGQLGLPFHLRTLSREDFAQGNKENVARELRLGFFKEVYQAIGAEALLLAHQMDDLAETILKRIFEGSGIFSWSGMLAVSKNGNVQIWRPLLGIAKKSLLEWLEEKGNTHYIVDQTNLDPAFLRGRMRTNLFPYLEEHFGKNIVSSLCALTEDALAVTTPLLELFSRCAKKAKRCLFGTYLDFEALHELPINQYNLFLKYFLGESNIAASRATLKEMAASLEALSVSKSFLLGGKILYVDRRRLFLVGELPEFPNITPLEEGRGKIGKWNYEIKWEESISCEVSSWLEALEGYFFVDLPKRSYHLVPFQTVQARHYKDFLLKRYSSAAVPTFLRSLCPLVIHNDELIHEFLTGKKMQKCPENISRRLSIRFFIEQK